MISNGSLLWRPDVREALNAADWVSVKVDAATEATWRRLNRPHPGLDFTTVQNGISRFGEEFNGDLVSETMLIDGINDTRESLVTVGEFLHRVGIHTSYLAIPTRPTPYPAITAPKEEAVNQAYQLLIDYVPRVEYLIGYEGDAFASSGDPTTDLLAITQCTRCGHPLSKNWWNVAAETGRLSRT